VPAPAPQPDSAAIRRELEERRDRARGKLAGLTKTPERGAAQGFGKRIGDGTTEAISRLTDIGVGSSVETGLARTERALAKLDEGTYGLCDVCGKPIEPARLAAMPDSVMCLADAGSQPRARPSRR
jgi:DnaK suppressor protein